jgi:hypothetical protein
LERNKSIQTFIDEWNGGHSPLLSYPGVDAIQGDVEKIFLEMIEPQPRDYVGLSLVGKHEALLALYHLGYREPIENRLRYVFLTGHVFESIILASMLDYGIRVEGQQEEVHIAGFPGHIDCVIEGELYDVKTMSASHFNSFIKKPTDMMGYITQLCAYHNALQDDVGCNPGWVCYNKETSELQTVYLFDHISVEDYDKYLERVYEKRQYLDAIKTLNDVQLIYVPEPRPEVYRKEKTGRLLLPQPLYMTYYSDAFYELEPGTNSYGKETKYITRKRTPPETIQWLHDNGIHYGDLIGYDFE